MKSGEQLVIYEESNENSSSIVLDLNVTKNRLTLWCIVYYIYAVTLVTATSLAGDRGLNFIRQALQLYAASACFILLATIITMINLYYIDIYKQITVMRIVSGIFFIIGGILHISANSVLIHNECRYRIEEDNKWCRIAILFPEFMAQYLSIMMGLDIITLFGDNRKIRLMAYNVLLCVYMLLASSSTNHTYKHEDNPAATTIQVALFIIGITCGLLFIVLFIHFIAKREPNHKFKEPIHRLIALILLSAVGLVTIYTDGFIGQLGLYQIDLLVLPTVVIIAYDLQFV